MSPKGAPVSYPNLDQICAAIKADEANIFTRCH